MKDLWQPEMSQAGSKAALLAHQKGSDLNLWQPTASADGGSAAALAFRNKGLSPQLDRGYTKDGRNASLLAATQSHNQGRARAGSTPVPRPAAYPDSHNSGKNALSAATVSHRASTRESKKMEPDGWSSEANQAARVQNMRGVDREMYTEHPNLEPTSEEKHNAALHASAISMAKQMMEHQNRSSTPEISNAHVGPAGAEVAHKRNQSSLSQTDLKQEAIKYIHLQDAAHKLAQERLAKVEKDMEPERYREHYGYGKNANQTSPKKTRSRRSVRGRGRKRASSEGQYFDDSSDEEQAQRIRSQMSQLSTAQNTVDDRKRQADRERLMAAAEKRVQSRMHDMDEKVFLETGKPSQAMMDDWETKAREKAERERAERDSQPVGKTHIGGGKYMDQADIEAIAAARLKPTLDELNETAEKRRARDEEMARERDQAHTAKMEEKIQKDEQKAEFKRIKGQYDSTHTLPFTNKSLDQDKAAAKREKEERKAAQRAEKEEARARKSEDVKGRKSEDKHRGRDLTRDGGAAVVGGTAAGVAVAGAEDPAQKKVEPAAADESKEQGGRTMFDRIVERLKGRPDLPEDKAQPVEKVADEPAHEKPVLETAGAHDKPTTTEEEPRTVPTVGAGEVSDKPTFLDYSADEHGDEAAVPFDPSAGTTGAAATHETAGEPTVSQPEPIAQHPQFEFEDEEEQRGRTRGAFSAAMLGVGGAGAATAAVVAGRRHRDDEEGAEVSSLSDEEDDDRVGELGHAGASDLASPPIVAGNKRPDLERHISTIDHSSGESDANDYDDEFADSEDDEGGEIFGKPTTLAHVDDHGPAIAREEPIITRDEPVAPVHEAPAVQETPTVQKEQPAAVQQPPLVVDTSRQPEAEEAAPVSPLAGLPRDAEGNIVLVKKGASPSSPHMRIGAPRSADPVSPPTETATPAPATAPAPAPAVKTGPSEESKTTPQAAEKEERSSRGFKGFLNKLRSKSKNEGHNKLHKNRAASDEQTEKEKPFQGGAKYTGAGTENTNANMNGNGDEKEEFLTPVTTTSAGREANGLPAEHVGTDGQIGDSQHISGLGGDPRAGSPSSFQRRHDKDLEGLDDASSSGTEEGDVTRGRQGKGKGRAGAESDDEQFEEARDHFDESLAPPPAFTGQKSESPVRETRFHERF